MLKELLDQPYHFQNYVSMSNLELSSMPIRLEQLRLMLMDDFEDGARDPKWLLPLIPGSAVEFTNPSSPIDFAFTATRFYAAQTFQMAGTLQVPKVRIKVWRPNLSTPGSLVVQLRTCAWSGSVWYPTSTVLASAGVPASSLPFDAGWADFAFSSPPTLNNGAYYAIVMYESSLPEGSPNGIRVRGEHGSFGSDLYAPGSAWLSQNSGGTWEKGPFSGFWVYDFCFQVYAPQPSPEPVETGGFLQYDYPSDLTPKDLNTVYNQVLYGLGMEYRFIWNRTSQTAGEAQDWGVQLLEGAITSPLTNAERDNKTLVELRVKPNPQNDELKLWAIVFDTSGLRKAYHADGVGWAGYAGQLPFVVPNASGVPITVRVTEDHGLPGRRITVRVYKNDDPAQVVFQTDISPVIRTLSGSIHLGIGNTIGLFGSRMRFDYFMLDGPTVYEPESGEVVIRRYSPFKLRAKSFRLARTLPAPGSAIRVRLRTADSIEGLVAAAWSDPLAGQVSGGEESGDLEMALGLYHDLKFEFVRGSPGPTLGGFDLMVLPQFVEDDQPIILSIDEAGPGRVKASTSEDNYVETPNSLKLVDSDAVTQWVSTTSGDVTIVNVSLQFMDASGNPENRMVNAVILRNANIKRLMVTLNGGVCFDGELTAADAIIPVTPQLAPRVDLTIWSTTPANDHKRIGEVYIGQVLLALPGFKTYEPGPLLVESGSFRTLGGKLIAYRGTSKYRSRWSATLVDQATKDVVEAIFKQNAFVTFWPEPKSRPRDLFDVAWKQESLPSPYSDELKAAGYTIEGEMEEI